ncbi:hypothetical protein XM38_023490 [Halomicronema hongdechloris C2206]|uniref:DUF547 domain-containing protein n=1 Tax=Halomicronema hongdechloris C2206 TaxID=1641165 RepID=A0A1Z3HMN4_9CYAN|nr:DUF547 domain-containing protein [Halomicronema hongdechloris]ASC71397.1 hypothetical protein XM38_023490 [Halomicronema hongdechloris C2206]
MEPGDDVWRYLWEGYIQTLGFSPYHLPPNAPALLPYRTEWWSQINHLDVSAIYPPLTQLGFRGLAAIAVSVLLFKLAFVAADLLVGWLLSRRFGPSNAILYAWNPMVIYAFAGGAHYDSWFILPLVAAWLLLEPPEDRVEGRRWLWSSLLLGLSIAVKWISLPLLAWLMMRSLRQRTLGRTLWIAGLGSLPMGLSALVFCRGGTCPLIPTSSTFVSHGRSAEFIPHWVAQVWPASLQANWIYGIPLAVVVLWLLLRTNTLRQFTDGYWFGVFLLSPIVHFWYFTWIVPFAVPSQNWGVRWLSLSSFVYFVLPHACPTGDSPPPSACCCGCPLSWGGCGPWGTPLRQSQAALIKNLGTGQLWSTNMLHNRGIAYADSRLAMLKPTALTLMVTIALLSGCSSASLVSQRETSTPSAATPASATRLSYDDYATVLATYVDEQGLVDYRALQANPQPLTQFIDRLGAVAPDTYAAWSDADQIAFLINAYNAITLQSIINEDPLKDSIKDIFGVWKIKRHTVAGQSLTLDAIEHDILRQEFSEPRIHAALVCAAQSCPPLRQAPYTGARLDQQLEDQVRRWLASPHGLQIDRDANRVAISAIFDWFGEDWQPRYAVESGFTGNGKQRATLNFISQYVSPEQRAYLLQGDYTLDYLDYDWSLNRQ